MQLVCSFCRKVIREDAGGPALDVSFGMCPACREHFERLWAGMSLSEYLDGLEQAVLVVTVDGRVVAANAKLAALFGREPRDMRGLLAGEAFACVHSRLPEGCGKTIHCRECTIRRAVNEVAETGVAQERIPAYLDTKEGRVPLRITVRAKDGLVKVVIEEKERARERAAEA